MGEDGSGNGPVATLALASLALLAAVAIGVAVIRKRNGRYAHQQVKTPLCVCIQYVYSSIPKVA